MSRASGDAESLGPGKSGDSGAKFDCICARLLNVSADAGANLDHRLMHFRLHLLTQEHAALVHHLGYMRTELARDRIDDLKLFFDSKREVRHRESRIFELRISEFRNDTADRNPPTKLVGFRRDRPTQQQS